MDFELPHATQRRIQERRSSKVSDYLVLLAIDQSYSVAYKAQSTLYRSQHLRAGATATRMGMT